MKVGILDYGVGNLYSIRCALEKRGAEAMIMSRLSAPPRFDALLLPGVGNFSPVAARLTEERSAMRQLVRSGVPILGVCLGMQLLFEGSEEGDGEGLGLIQGWVQKLPTQMKIPHMGWNNLKLTRKSGLMDDIPDGSWVYFVHSYYPAPAEDVTVAEVNYGVNFPAVVEKGHICGTQFHPEKSGPAGSKMLDNFLVKAQRSG